MMLVSQSKNMGKDSWTSIICEYYMFRNDTDSFAVVGVA
jgi:hypothetical protein